MQLTVSKWAKLLNIPVCEFLVQLQAAGIAKRSPNDLMTEAENTLVRNRKRALSGRPPVAETSMLKPRSEEDWNLFASFAARLDSEDLASVLTTYGHEMPAKIRHTCFVILAKQGAFELLGNFPKVPRKASTTAKKLHEPIRVSMLPPDADIDERAASKRELSSAFNAFLRSPTEARRDELSKLVDKFCDARPKRSGRGAFISGGLPGLGKTDASPGHEGRRGMSPVGDRE